jgi:endonuclease/exonuclease/phosphatase family metal-dependent hydrolase
MAITLATYNIHACIGADGRFDPERTVGVLLEIGADLVALQEVERHVVDGRDLLDYLAAAVGMKAFAGPTLLRGTRGYGNALLTSLPLHALDRIDLSLPRREPRGAMNVRLAWGDRRLQVVATHLGLRPGERRQQVRRLLPLFEAEHADVAVLLGDLNEWLLWGRPLRWLRRHFAGNLRPPPTYPSRLPLFALDRIWVRPHRALIRLEAHRSRLARLASDHLPLKGVLSLAGGEREGYEPPRPWVPLDAHQRPSLPCTDQRCLSSSKRSRWVMSITSSPLSRAETCSGRV